MKKGQIKIGARSKSARAQLVCQYDRPETLQDCLKWCGFGKLADNVQAALESLPPEAHARVAVRFNRGLTIWLQDAIGRPGFEAGDSQESIQKLLDSAVSGETKGASRAKPAPTVVIPKNAKSFTPQQVKEMLARANVKAVEAE